MKNKVAHWGIVIFALVAALIRALENGLTIGADGYYLAVPLAPILKWCLIGVLALGVLWSIIAYWGNKETTDAETLYGTDRMPRFLFAVLGLLTVADGVICFIFEAGSTLEKVGAVLIALGALGWFGMAYSPKRTGLWIILPTLQFSVQIIVYFWSTYKEIHVSANILGMLGWCAALFFVHSLGKVLVGATCTKGRLGTACGLVIVVLFPAFILSDTDAVLHYAYGILLVMLAAHTLKCLPREPQKLETVEGPDLSVLNEYMDAIPEVEEE